MLLFYWVGIYLFLARFFKMWSKTVQIHSIVHCVVAFIWTSFVLFVYLNNDLLSTNFSTALQGLLDREKHMILLASYHSAGYFLADTIDILIDYKNKKRQIYIFHHVVAFSGIITVYWGSYLAIYAIWCLEIGGIVHHLKHAAEVNNFGPVLYYMSHMLYHIVYLFSRILLGLNVFNGFSGIYETETILTDLVGLTGAVVLLIQNGIWWVHNLKKSFSRQ